MAQQSQAGQVGFKTQAAMGTFDSPGAAAPDNGIFPRVTSGSMTLNRDIMYADAEIGGTRDKSQGALGSGVYEGSYEMYGRLNTLAVLLNAALGATTSTDNTSWGRHVITGVDGSTELPWLSIEEAIGQSFDVFQYTDARVNSITISAEAGGFLMVTAEIVAIDGSSGHTRTDLTAAPGSTYVDSAPLIVGGEIIVTHAGLSLCAKSFSITISNNFETDDYCLGDNKVDTFTPKEREITANMTLRPDDSALWKQANYGASGATTMQDGLASTDAMQVAITSATEITAGVPFAMTIDIPEMIINPFEVAPSGDDVIEIDADLRAVRSDPAVSVATFTIDNELTALV